MKSKLMILSIMLMAYFNGSVVSTDLRQEMLESQAEIRARYAAKKGTSSVHTLDENTQITASDTTVREVSPLSSTGSVIITDYGKATETQWNEEAEWHRQAARYDEQTYQVVTEAILNSIFPQAKRCEGNQTDLMSSKVNEQVTKKDHKGVVKLGNLHLLERDIVPLTEAERRAQDDAAEIKRLQDEWRVQVILYPIPQQNVISPLLLSEKTKFEKFKSYVVKHPYEIGAVVVGGLITGGVVAYKKGYFKRFKFKNPFAKAKSKPKSSSKHRRDR